MIQLAEIANIKAGYPFRGSIKPAPNNGVLAVQMRDLRIEEGVINWDGAVTTRLTGKREPDWLRSGDILLPSVGGRSQSILVGEVPAPAVCSPHIFQIRLTATQVEPGYIACALRQSEAQRQIAGAATGGTVKLLRRAVLENIRLPIPSIHRQRQIAELMATAMAERRALEALIANRERQLAGIAQKLFNEEINQEVVS